VHQRLAVVNDRQDDGVQAVLRCIENLAAPEAHKTVAEGPRGVRFKDGIEVIEVA
jgi:hypothetical protein